MGNQVFTDALLGQCCTPILRKDGDPFGGLCGTDSDKIQQERLELRREAIAQRRRKYNEIKTAGGTPRRGGGNARAESKSKNRAKSKRKLREQHRNSANSSLGSDGSIDGVGLLADLEEDDEEGIEEDEPEPHFLQMMARRGMRLHLFLLFGLLLLWKYLEETGILTAFFLLFYL
ncbi:unnamed protein product, partial [Amoebophrya sp. A25]|eukprot:GSA25T00007690001.1